MHFWGTATFHGFDASSGTWDLQVATVTRKQTVHSGLSSGLKENQALSFDFQYQQKPLIFADLLLLSYECD